MTQMAVTNQISEMAGARLCQFIVVSGMLNRLFAR
jgi:hypothetical protein